MKPKSQMRAMQIHCLGEVTSGSRPLREDRIPMPVPGDDELLIISQKDILAVVES